MPDPYCILHGPCGEGIDAPRLIEYVYSSMLSLSDAWSQRLPCILRIQLVSPLETIVRFVCDT